MADPVTAPKKARRDVDDGDLDFLDHIKKFFSKGAQGDTKEITEKGGPGGQRRMRAIDSVVDEAVATAKPDPY
jgi:hypothetical protein